MALRFEILGESSSCGARLGRVTTPHGVFDTPAFMPVGTQASIKGLTPEAVAGTGTQIILANTYHLLLRPGGELVEAMGGLQKWMGWHRPMLTDSGGFQVFSLSDVRKINDDGVTFKSHIDGATVELTPARSIAVQNQLGADIIMAFDDCPPGSPPPPAEVAPEVAPEVSEDTRGLRPGLEEGDKRIREAVERSARWLDECVKAHRRASEQALFGIVQGGTDLALREWSLGAVLGHDLPGYAIGGVAVGEGYEGLRRVVEFCGPKLPGGRPRYLMGVGYERDILTAVRAGVDMFDCVLPTRNGRNGNAFTPTGQARLRNAKFARDEGVIDGGCDCPACAGGFSRSYLRHLFMAGEMLGPVLVSLHNVRHFQRFMLDIRRAIVQNDWSLVARAWPVSVGARSARAGES
ncbi:MAG: tRNA guanosine(34) transglycosylase Tgt [Phycisphaeraceae bacterium]|nr:tRNA guanosine(34) transglycosylase Tgt [Phycisphaeraceae bacterium]